MKLANKLVRDLREDSTHRHIERKVRIVRIDGDIEIGKKNARDMPRQKSDCSKKSAFTGIQNTIAKAVFKVFQHS